MARFEKTRLHWYTAGLLLFGLYALAGLGYAAYVGSTTSVTIWAVLAALAFVGALVFQKTVGSKKKRPDLGQINQPDP